MVTQNSTRGTTLWMEDAVTGVPSDEALPTTMPVDGSFGRGK